MPGVVQPPEGSSPLDKQGHTTYHLTPADYWEAHREDGRYFPEGFEAEGFIHCTDTIEEVIAVGNRYYQADERPFVLLELDCERIAAPIVYEVPNRIFPHIYGALEVGSVRSVRSVERTPDGVFVSIDGFTG